ncbi:MAG: Eco57I restriction-modification methylase domain-containing protein [Promethearchaeia archaeon]
MNDYEKSVELKRNLSRLDDIIHSKDIKMLIELINNLNYNEAYFLKGYKRRKAEGVYFTDKKIARFIAERVILRFLNKKLGIQKNINDHIKNLEEIRFFPDNIKKDVFKLVFNLKICDPACGSGIFLTTIAETLLDIILQTKESNNPSKPEIKKKIISNLFGLDINQYFIELCKLNLLKWFKNDNLYNLEDFRIFTILNANIKQKDSIFSNNWIKKEFNLRHFDIIIGNPPYGNILNKSKKRFLKEHNLFYNDIYCTFLIKSIDWIKDGIIGFLVPKSFLLRQNYFYFRNDFLSKINISEIFDLGPNIFKKATNEVQIIIYERKQFNENLCNIYDFPNKHIISYRNGNFDSLKICQNKECNYAVYTKKFYIYTYENNCPFCNGLTTPLNRIRIKCTKGVLEIINKIERRCDLNYLSLYNFPKMIRGEEDYALKLIRNLLKNPVDLKLGNSYYFIDAKKDLKYYYINKTKPFNLEKLDPKILKGQNFEYYKGAKLLIKHNNIYPEAVFDDDNVCFTSSIYSLLYEDPIELKFLCGLINSAIIQFYCIFGINNQKGTTINLNQYMIRHLPIATCEKNMKKNIAQYVDVIISSFKKEQGKLNEFIINKIKMLDDIIFNLYNINNEQKKLILNSLRNKVGYFKTLYEK